MQSIEYRRPKRIRVTNNNLLIAAGATSAIAVLINCVPQNYLLVDIIFGKFDLYSLYIFYACVRLIPPFFAVILSLASLFWHVGTNPDAKHKRRLGLLYLFLSLLAYVIRWNELPRLLHILYVTISWMIR